MEEAGLLQHGATWWWAVLLFAFSSTVTPGPNNIMIMASGLNYGIKRSLPHLLGIAIGFPLMVLMVGLGLTGVFTAWPQLHSIIQIVGIVYLLYLAWGIATADDKITHNKSNSQPLSFVQAALFQWVNPKAWVMASGAVAAYTSIDVSLMPQVLAITMSFFLVAWPCVGLWLFFGVALSRLLKQRLYRRWFNIAMALLLLASIMPSLSALIGLGV